MTNSSNSISYLVIYLVIILILIYAITFMSSYTCNVNPQQIDMYNSKGNHENFENGQGIFVLGAVNMAPWYVNSFADQTAQWIWYTQGADQNAQIDNAPVTFIVTFNVASPTQAVIHVIADNTQGEWGNKVWLNPPTSAPLGDISDGGWTLGSNYTKLSANLVQGTNTIMFSVMNTGGGAGLLVSVIANNAVLINSSSKYIGNWSYSKSLAVGGSVGTPQAGIDYPGNDISDMSIDYAEQCANSCGQTPTCNAFVTNLNGTYCWLKGQLGQQNNNTDRVTYTYNKQGPFATGNYIGSPQVNIDYPGNDIINEGVNSAQDCANACQSTVGCNAFVTNKAGNYCWLKGSLGQQTSNSDRVTYKFNRPPLGTMAAPPISSNDFTLVAVGYANQVYLQDVISGVWYPNSPAVQNSQSVIDLAVMPDSSLIGVGTDNQLYSRQTLNSPWVNMNINGQFNAVSVANDGHTLILVGKDTNIYMFDLNKPSTPVQLVDNGHYVLKMIQLQNGQFFAIGTDTRLYIGNGTFNPYTISWAQVPTNNCCAKSIAQAPDGSIILLDTNGKIQVASSVGAGWTMTQACCFSAIAVMPIPPQRILEYDRKGAFVDNNSRMIPNAIGNFNTLSECISAAKSQGYNTVGYQYMNYCFAGNNSPYDQLGFQSDNTASVSAYPGAWTNIVYKTNQELVTTQDPDQGEVYIYEQCQFSGGGSKIEVGEHPDFGDSIPIKSMKVGINTAITLYELPNYQGRAIFISGYSDVVSKDFNCSTVGPGTFSSAKVSLNNNAMPYNSSNLTNGQLVNLWTSVGCNAESSAIQNKQLVANWKGQLYKTTADTLADMKAWATDNDPEHKAGCYMSTASEDSPAEGEVVLFEDCNYEGKYKKFGLGDVTYVGDDFNDITSAITIGPYTMVTIYENTNYGGKSITFKNESAAVSGISCLIANNFNDMLSSLKVASAFQKVNFYLSLQAENVNVLGPWNTPQWNVSTFADKTAKWIWWNDWNGTFPNGSAAVDPKPVRFQLLVPNTTNFEIPVVIHVIADDAPAGANFVKVNNQLVGQIIGGGWVTPNYSKIDTGLAPGNNLLEFDVQNVVGAAGLLVSVINANTNAVIANSGSGQWGWVDPSKVVSSLMSEMDSNLVIHDEAAKGKVVKFKDLKEIPQFTVGGTFRLTVNLKDVPPYIKGQQFSKGDSNTFYLSIEKLDPNCSVMQENNCLNVYADNKKCSNNALTNVTQKNAYRLVLVSKDYVLDPEIPFGKNVDFTLVKINDRYYLKNIQTGFMPKLFKNDFKQDLFGYIDTGYLSNYNTMNKNTNKVCGKKQVVVEEANKKSTAETLASKASQEFINCSTNADGGLYLMSTTNILESNPLKFVLNKDGTVNISLQISNPYGTFDRSFSLIFCNFNVDTYAYIEKLTNPLGTFLINMVCFDSDQKRIFPNNSLNFNFEISRFPDSYLRERNIKNLNN